MVELFSSIGPSGYLETIVRVVDSETRSLATIIDEYNDFQIVQQSRLTEVETNFSTQIDMITVDAKKQKDASVDSREIATLSDTIEIQEDVVSAAESDESKYDPDTLDIYTVSQPNPTSETLNTPQISFNLPILPAHIADKFRNALHTEQLTIDTSPQFHLPTTNRKPTSKTLQNPQLLSELTSILHEKSAVKKLRIVAEL